MANSATLTSLSPSHAPSRASSRPASRGRAGERLRASVEPGSRTIVAQMITTPAASERLMRAVEEGLSDFVITSADGSVAIRGRLSVDAVHVTEESFGGGAVVIDWAEGVVSNGRNRVSLSRTELRVLNALLERNGKATRRTVLVARIWPNDAANAADHDNALPVYMCGLRKRLTAIGLGSVIGTVRGVGYRISL